MASTQKTLEDVLESIDRETVPSCMLIYGDESYLVDKALSRIVERIFPEGAPELNLFYMDGERTDVERICETILTPSLIPGRKVVVVAQTGLLTSRTSVPALIQEAAGKLQEDPPAAARLFLRFAGLMGWTLDGMVEGEWKKITDAEWHSMTGEEGGVSREEFFPTILSVCQEQNITTVPTVSDTDRLESILNGQMPDTMSLILTASAADKRKRLYKVISETGVVLHYPRITKEAQQKQLFSEAASAFLSEKGKKLTADALAALGERVGYAYQEALGALDKVATYVGDRSRIERADVEAVTGATKEEKVFALTTALTEKKLEEALLVLNRLLEQELHPLMILAMMIREVRLLIQGKMLLASGIIPSPMPARFNDFQNRVYPLIKEASGKEEKKAVQLYSQHPYVMYNALRNARRFSWDELMGYMDRLVETDITLKSSGAQPRLVMERLVIDLCGK